MRPIDPRALLHRFQNLRVLVIGDVMLDTYLEGEATRLCSEGPVPVVRKTEEQRVPGGAANTAANVRALGAEVLLLGIVGHDSAGSLLREALRERGINDRWLVEDATLSTLHKLRVIANGQYVVRYDEGNKRDQPCSPVVQQQLLSHLDELHRQCDVIIVSDYCYGVLFPELIARLHSLQRVQPRPWLIDSKALQRYQSIPATILTPNYSEALALLAQLQGRPADYDHSGANLAEVEQVARLLLTYFRSECIALTLGAHGVFLLEHSGDKLHLSAHPVDCVNDVGAGDTFSAALALALGAGGTLHEAAAIGIDAAGIAVSKPRTVAVQYQELLRRVNMRTYETYASVSGDAYEACCHDMKVEDTFSGPRSGTFAGATMLDERWRDARNILLIRLDNLGDVLLTTPAFHAVKETLPEARLTLLASPVGAQVAELDPDIDEVIVYQSPQMDPWRTLPQDSEREQHMIALLKARHFDGALIFTSFRQSSLPAAYLCYLADIPLRAAASIDGSGSLLTTRHKHPEHMMHEVERGLDLVAALNMHTSERAMVLKVPDSVRERIVQRLEQTATVAETVHSGPLVVVHPGCSMPARTYPWEMYAEVVSLLISRLGARVCLTGVASERELVERIIARVPADRRSAIQNMAGELMFPELCALIQHADLTVTNNTGPMHISSAVKTPVVALFALTNPPEQWGPWQVPHRLLFHDVSCRICYSRVCPYQHECLRLVTPKMVVSAANELLAEVAQSPQPVTSHKAR
jgi:lipopolysaccharide heptosyltransferase II